MVRQTALLARWRADSLARNSAHNMTTTIATSAFGFAYWAVAARLYSAANVGLAAALIAAMTLVATLSTTGFGSAMIQLLPRSRSDATRTAVSLAGLACAGIVGLVGGVAAVVILPHVVQDLGSYDMLALGVVFGAAVVAWSVSMLLDSIYVARREASGMLKRNAIFSALKVPLLALPPFTGLGAMGILTTWLGAAVLVNALTLHALLRHRWQVPLVRMRLHMSSVVRLAAGHHLINLGGMVPMYALPIIVAMRLTPSDTAYFYATWRTGALFFMISAAVATSLFAEGMHGVQLAHAIRRSARLTLFLLVPVALVSGVFGESVLSLFGKEYADKGTALFFILLASAVPDAITNIAVGVLRVVGKLRHAVALNAGMCVIALGLAWVLLPPYGIAGAGVAWLAAQSVGSLVVLAGLFGARRRLNAVHEGNVTLIGQ